MNEISWRPRGYQMHRETIVPVEYGTGGVRTWPNVFLSKKTFSKTSHHSPDWLGEEVGSSWLSG
jgi:hypothetical protein